jgi:serine/threonine-protein kinase
MYRLARALEEAGSFADARELYGQLFRRDLDFRDAGKRFLALDQKLVQETTVLGPEGVLQALRAAFDGVERLASGAAGLLYKCLERETGEPVAVKVLDPRLLSSGEALARFRREVEVLESLDHPGIVRFHGATFGKLCYYRMDFIEGQSLAVRLGTGWRASEEESVSILRQAADALAHAHEAGVLHRDLKPSNLMLGPGGRLVVVDFGVARIEGAERLTREGTFVGTMSCAAPEQLRGEAVDVRADVYSLGAAVRELGGDAAAGWRIGPLLAAMSAEDPAARPSGMREVLARLEAAGRGP